MDMKLFCSMARTLQIPAVSLQCLYKLQTDGIFKLSVSQNKKDTLDRVPFEKRFSIYAGLPKMFLPYSA